MEVDVVERLSLVPGENPLVEHGVRNGEGFQNPRRVFPYAVPDGHKAVLHIQHAVHIGLPGLHFLLEVVLFPGRLVKGCVPLVEFADCCLGGVCIIEGIELRPVNRVTGISERVPDQNVRQGVLDGNVVLISERICIFQ